MATEDFVAEDFIVDDFCMVAREEESAKKEKG